MPVDSTDATVLTLSLPTTTNHHTDRTQNMGTTKRRQYRSFDTMADDTRWLGFGYLGMRQSFIAADEEPEGRDEMTLADRVRHLADADAFVVEWAQQHRWTDRQLFTWANSKNGRWFGEAALGYWDGRDWDWDLTRYTKLLTLP